MAGHKPPQVSIIVPVYNTAPYLRQCLDSLVSQTLNSVEVIVVDDASTDSSPEVLRTDYQPLSNFTIVTHDSNRGPGAARNSGIMRASGQYIGFVDSDDWASPEMYARLYGRAVSESADVVCGGYTKVRADGTPLRQHQFPVPIGTVPSDRFLHNLSDTSKHSMLWFCCRNLYRSDIARASLFDETVRFAEDSVFNLLAFAHATTITITNHCDYYYRKTPLSLTSPTAREGMLEDLETQFRTKKDLFQEYPRSLLLALYNYVTEDQLPFLVRNAVLMGNGDPLAVRREMRRILNAGFIRECVAGATWFRAGRSIGHQLALLLAKFGMAGALRLWLARGLER